MIIFKKITFKNFLGVGESPMSVDFTRSHTTLITGKNGQGKSSIVDALTYALYGRPYRNINIPQLVNSINGKNLEAILEFTIGKTQYKIIRGVKPKIFEIYKDGKLINQDSANKDYQKYLEQHILKMNYKVFSQIVVLSSSNFVPFMQLSASDRRNVIEDLLDIQVFSRMNELLKTKLSQLKDDVEKIKTQETMLINNLQVHKKYLEKKKEDAQTSIVKLKQNIKDYKNRISEIEKDNKAKQNEIYELSVNAIITDEEKKSVRDLAKEHSKKVTTLELIDEKIRFFNDNETCHHCEQDISESFKEKMNEKLLENREVISLDEAATKKLYDSLMAKFDAVEKVQTKIKEIRHEIIKNDSKISAYEESLKNIESELTNIKEKSQDDQTFHAKEIEDFKENYKQIKTKKAEFSKLISLYNLGLIMLKDAGIKTKIIKQYIPIINQLINKFLKEMDFHIQFEINETFNEVIKTRHKDSFSYESFSEGEKARIDLALLFTWREIARIRNSASCNLLFLDETFDSSLDTNADDALIKILYDFKKTNIFVISHRGASLYDKLHSHIQIEKVNNFTKIL